MSTRARILVVEDEEALRQGICDLLAFKGFAPVGSERGDDGCKKALAEPWDLVILDRMLPGMSGTDICAAVRDARPSQPILLLTALGRESDILAGFEAGCDDYITKPFSLAVLVARVSALVRRSTGARQLTSGELSVDIGAYIATGSIGNIDLSPRDIALMVYLADRRERAVSRDELLAEVWDYRSVDRVNTRAIDMHVVKLRRKLAQVTLSADPIETVRGVGYRWIG
ncbi:MAG: two-component system response regulator RegX3 [Myxococcota bacterium]|jgi:two-component system response regulator RegX3